MREILNKLKTGAFYLYSAIIYLIIFFIIWIASHLFLTPNVYNFMIRNFSATKVGNPDTVIVAIDDKSIDEIRWPWSRNLQAKIIDYFREYTDINILGLDAIFKGKDTNSAADNTFFNSVTKYNDKIVGVFIPSLQTYPSNINGEIYEKYFNDRFKITIEDKRTKKIKPFFNSLMPFPAEYFFSIKHVGSAANDMHLINKTIHNTYTLVDIHGELYPSFALRMYLLINDTNKITLYDDKLVVDKTQLTIPFINSHYISGIRFYKFQAGTNYSHKKYSAIDIIKSYDALKNNTQPIISPEEFKNKNVLFGINAVTQLIDKEDAHSTPVDTKQPGVDIQATILDNYLTNDMMYRPNIWHEIVLSLILSILTFIMTLRLNFGISLTAITGTILGYLWINAGILYPNNIAPDAISPIVLIITTLIFGYAFKSISENKNKEKVKNAMGRYVSQDVMQNIVKNIDNIRLGGKKATVSVLFADIRGFTSMSEKMTAEEVSVILNEYFSAIEPIITKYNGVINKFIGDAVMAIFGDPIEDELHPMKAVLCANEMLKCVRKLRYKWMDENKPDIEIGLGINTGEVFVGNIGSEKRLEYTVIGDTVNIASRIESYNKVYKTKFLIGETTYEYVKNRVDVIKIGGVTIRGKKKKMDIYEILRVNAGINDDKNN